MVGEKEVGRELPESRHLDAVDLGVVGKIVELD